MVKTKWGFETEKIIFMLVCSGSENIALKLTYWPLNGPWLALTAPQIPWDYKGCTNWIDLFKFLFIFIIFQHSWEVKIRKKGVYYNRPCQKVNFVWQISRLPKVAQKWFCIQNLRMWVLVFRRKKQFENPILGCQDICKINAAPFFLKHPVHKYIHT